jgi:tetratricopeptide (TPR) repeat protein
MAVSRDMTESELKDWRRRFAVELNNHAWDLVEMKERRTAEQTERMIHAAHGSCYLWLTAGNVVNHLRAQVLITTAYAEAGLAESALRHAERGLELLEAAGADAAPFDKATAYAASAHAHKLAGSPQLAREHYQRALVAAKPLDEGEKEVFDELYPEP